MDEIRPLYAFTYPDLTLSACQWKHTYMFLFGQGQQFKLFDTRWTGDDRNVCSFIIMQITIKACLNNSYSYLQKYQIDQS